MTQGDKAANKRMKSDNVQAMLMIAPFLIGFILFGYVPIIYILRYAFTDFGGFGECKFTGIANFVRIIKRPITQQAIRFLTPLITSGFQGMILIRRPPTEKHREAPSMAAMPVRFLLWPMDVLLELMYLSFRRSEF